MRSRSVLILVALFWPAPALAQAPPLPAWVISVGAGYQVPRGDFVETFQPQINQEQAEIRGRHETRSRATFDGGLTYRLRRQWVVSGGVSFSGGDEPLGIDAAIPHPFDFDADRALVGSTTTRRSEVVMHVHVGRFVSIGRNWLVTVGAGPAIGRTSIDLIRAVRYSESYPYDVVSFAPPETDRVTGTGIGASAGADVLYRFSRQVGLGGFVRYSHVSERLSTADHTSTVKIGGTASGVGLRIIF